MRKYLMVYVLLMWLFTACAPRLTPQSLLPKPDSYPNGSYPNNSYLNGANPSPQPPADLTPAESAAIAALSMTLNLPPGQITLISTEAVEWPDGCLGVQKIGVMCTQAIVPGYKIILEANGEQYEFHTNEDGSAVKQVVAMFESVEEQVINQLASNLGLNESDISIVSNSNTKFADACLDVAMPHVVCAKVVTSGKIIVLEADDVQYEYHFNNDGTQVQPATFALTWTRTPG